MGYDHFFGDQDGFPRHICLEATVPVAAMIGFESLLFGLSNGKILISLFHASAVVKVRAARETAPSQQRWCFIPVF